MCKRMVWVAGVAWLGVLVVAFALPAVDSPWRVLAFVLPAVAVASTALAALPSVLGDYLRAVEFGVALERAREHRPDLRLVR